ncbi:hypothetical protein N9R54_04235 [Pelobium sp.]|nr:hypothetical protein [Pelobium sp.]MDA9555422.1 hypothetical protein [Pelobium sp.]
MKKIFGTLIIMIVSLSFAKAQATATISPSRFTAEDAITITFDLSNSTLGDNGEDVYIWGFVPGCCGSPLNDQNGYGWGNSNPLAKCTPIGNKKYTYTLTPTAYMNKTAAQIGATFGFLAKNQTGSRQTQDFTFPVDPLTYTPSVFRVFPSKFTQDDIVTFFMDKNLLDPSKTALKAATEVYVYTDIDYIKPDGVTTGYFQTSQYCEPLNTNDGNFYTGQTTVADNLALKAKDEGNGLFSWTIVPSKFFKIGDTTSPKFPPAGSKITRIKVHFRTRLSPYCPGTVGDAGSLGDNFGFPLQ